METQAVLQLVFYNTLIIRRTGKQRPIPILKTQKACLGDTSYEEILRQEKWQLLELRWLDLLIPFLTLSMCIALFFLICCG